MLARMPSRPGLAWPEMRLGSEYCRTTRSAGKHPETAVRSLLSPSALRFCIVGVANTLVGLGIIYGAKYFFGVADVPANVIGYGVGVLVSYSLNRRWTFVYTRAVVPSFLRFIGVLAVAYLLNLATTILAVRLGINSYIAQALGVPPYTLFGYLASRYFVFRHSR